MHPVVRLMEASSTQRNAFFMSRSPTGTPVACSRPGMVARPDAGLPAAKRRAPALVSGLRRVGFAGRVDTPRQILGDRRGAALRGDTVLDEHRRRSLASHAAEEARDAADRKRADRAQAADVEHDPLRAAESDLLQLALERLNVV